MSNLPSIGEIAQFVDDTLRGQLDPNGSGAYDNHPGSDNAALISLLTKVGVKLYAYTAERNKASITASSEGADLIARVRDLYFGVPKEASVAQGTIYLHRTGAMLATSIQVGTRFGTQASGTQEAVEFEASATVSAALTVAALAVPVACLKEGVVGNVDLISVTETLDPLDDPLWTIYIPAPGDPVLGLNLAADTIGGGAEAETEDELKSRILARPPIATPGTAAGVYQGATDVQGVASAVAVEVGDGTGVVYAGDPNFQLPSALTTAVRASLESWRAFGVPIGVHPFNRQLLQVSVQVYMQRPLTNYDRTALKTNALGAIKRYFLLERLRPDEYLVGAIGAAVAKANSETQKVNVTSPAVDVLRPLDSAYRSVNALNRYYVTDATLDVQFFDPAHS